MKDFLKFLWLIPVGVILWFIYKLFIKRPEDDEVPIFDTSVGLSPNDLDIYNRVVNLMSNGSNPYSLVTGSSIYTLMYASGSMQNAIELGQNLARVEDKRLFSEVYSKKKRRLLTSDIYDIYGQQVYNMISLSVPDFGQFIL